MDGVLGTKICVVTVASRQERGYWLFRESCVRHGVDPVVLGLGEPYHKNTDKLQYLNRFLSQVPNGFDYVLFCDAFDVIFASGLSQIAAAYSRLNSPLVFSTERACWPDVAVASRYPSSPTPYRFLNSGLWMGEIGMATKLLKKLAQQCAGSQNRSDQRLYTEAYLSGEFPIALDHRCSVFQSLHLALDDMEWSDQTGAIKNRVTGGKPLIFHGNGGSNMYFPLIHFRLIPTFQESFNKAVRLGLMSENQYRFIADLITSYESCRTLVIGAGHDTELWYHCCRGNMACAEDRAEWLPRLPCKLVRPEYVGKIGKWLPDVSTPKAIAQSSWDVVIVDGPKGDTPDSPGRQESISWAARSGARFVLVHDYERDWERQLCDHYLGQPCRVVPFATRDNRVLAVFDRTDASQRSELKSITKSD